MTPYNRRPMLVWLNGSFLDEADAAISLRDTGLLHGAGVFTTMRSYGRRVFRIEQHLRRLRDSCEALCIPLQHKDEVTQKADGGINYTAIRYAEVLLWEAEALAELGRTSEALVPLEAVRGRARAQSTDPVNSLPQITTTDQQELIDIIRHERLVELGFEMHRFFDLVRWGIAAEVVDGFVPGKNEVFPIPQTEIDLNPNLTQNNGY